MTTELMAHIEKIIVGTSRPAAEMKRLLALVAKSDTTVLAQGPTGSGKELVARALHHASGRKGRLISVNCAAIPAELLESELFGYERGAFTGADKRRPGRVEEAHGGTLFLDEVGDMPLLLQSKLLRVLENRTVQRVGSGDEIAVDFRLVCATHQSLDQKVDAGLFRADLFYRINVFAVDVPSLSERRADIPLILEALVNARAESAPHLPRPQFDVTALHALAAHDWPGNVRELRNVLDRAQVLFPDTPITGAHVNENLLRLRAPRATAAEEQAAIWETVGELAQDLGVESDHHTNQDMNFNPQRYRSWFDHNDQIDLRQHLRDVESELVRAALERSGGMVSRAADLLTLRRTTLIEKMRKLEIESGAD